MAEVKKKFKKFDKNRDGKISHKKLKDVLHALGSRTTLDEVSCIMSEIDKDDNNFINLNEFAEFHMRGLTSLDSFGNYELQTHISHYSHNNSFHILALISQAKFLPLVFSFLQ